MNLLQYLNSRLTIVLGYRENESNQSRMNNTYIATLDKEIEDLRSFIAEAVSPSVDSSGKLIGVQDHAVRMVNHD